MARLVRSLVVLLGITCTLTGCRDNPASPSSAQCRTVPVTTVLTVTSPETNGSVTLRCDFDRNSATFTCQGAPSTPICRGRFVSKYKSISDFVDEGQVVGKLLAIETIGVLNQICSDEPEFTTTYVYDGQGRLTSAATEDGATVRFSNFDSQGRFRQSVDTGGGPCPMTSVITYNDGSRTVQTEGTTPAGCPLGLRVSATSRYSANLVDVTTDTMTLLAFGGTNLQIPTRVSMNATSTTTVCK